MITLLLFRVTRCQSFTQSTVLARCWPQRRSMSIKTMAQNHFHTAPNGPIRQELEAHLSDLYPEGLSKHGKFYLLDHVQANETWAVLSHVTRMVPISPMIELVYELVRRNDFPARPSWYASMFALETDDDAIHFRSARGWQGRIFKVESASAFRVDMNQLQIDASSIVALLKARSTALKSGCMTAIGSFEASQRAISANSGHYTYLGNSRPITDTHHSHGRNAKYRGSCHQDIGRYL